MQILQSCNFGALIQQRANAASRGMGGRQRGDTRNVIANGGTPDGFFVVERFAAERGVNDQIDLASFHEVNDVGPAFVYLKHGFRFNSRGFEGRSRATRGEQAEAEIMEFFAKRSDVLFVAIIDAKKNSAFARQPLPGRELRF